jgi:haloalkane dehalogenase
MAVAEAKRLDAIAYREAAPDGPAAGDPVLCLHGFPESSYMWRDMLDAIARETGRRAAAPDLAGYGDTPPDPPGTWERQTEVVERFREGLELERVALVVHDWGGLIGLRWACDHPGAVSALVISDTGFFADFKWHGMARVMRTPGDGEKLIASFEREAFGQLMANLSSGFDGAAIDEYWKAFTTDEGRAGVLELYRSGDREKLDPYRGKLAELGVPTLLLWGESDPFAPVAGAYRFQKEIPGAELVVVEGTGHFVYDDAPERCAREVTRFLNRV